MSKSRKIKKVRKLSLKHDEEYFFNLLRKNMKKYRAIRNITQEELAEMSGISRAYITDIENESRFKHPSLGYIGRIADALDISISELLKEDD